MLNLVIMRLLKIIGYSSLLLILVIGGYISYFFFFHNEIDITKPNSNEQPLNNLSLTTSTLTNIWDETITVQKGTLVVPENRSKEKSNNISISFIKIPTSNPIPFVSHIFSSRRTRHTGKFHCQKILFLCIQEVE